MREVMDQITLSTAISYDSFYREFITIEVASFNEERTKPTSFAIRRGSLVLSKQVGKFFYEPNHSNRDGEFFAEFRFSSFDEAFEYARSKRLTVPRSVVVGFCKCNKRIMLNYLEDNIHITSGMITSMQAVINRMGTVHLIDSVGNMELEIEQCICGG